ncbi:MAG TPA: hypothetical protein VIS06_08800, partial [Mycobacteriales bacterium]
ERMLNATKPDLAWTHRDNLGHFHAYSKGGELPTLRTELVHVPCDDGCCEGYSIPEYHCRICGEVVDPPVVPDREAMQRGVPMAQPVRWTVEAPMVEGFAHDLADTLSVVIRAGGRVLFGFACVAEAQWTGTLARDATGTVTLEGLGELAEMASTT